MKLTSTDEKINFLCGLYKEIQRIYAQNLTESDYVYFVPQKTKTGEYLQRYTLEQSQDNAELTNDLPARLSIKNSRNKTTFTFKLAKLQLLTELYNEVQKVSLEDKDLDLSKVFSEFKKSHSEYRINHSEFLKVEEVIKYHRRASQREGSIFANSINFFTGEMTKSAIFLEKYEFFKAGEDQEINDLQDFHCIEL